MIIGVYYPRPSQEPAKLATSNKSPTNQTADLASAAVMGGGRSDEREE